MKRLTLRTLSATVLVVAIALVLISCQDKSINPTEPQVGGGSLLKIEQINYTYLIGVGGFPDNKTVASNGDTIIVSGSGTLSIHRKFVDGGGTYIQKNSSGATVSSGLWFANRLINFRSYGDLDPTNPTGFEGGRASMRVQLSPGLDGSSGTDATLDMECLVGQPPPSAVEGIELRVPGGTSFTQIVNGSTLFIRQP